MAMVDAGATPVPPQVILERWAHEYGLTFDFEDNFPCACLFAPRQCLAPAKARLHPSHPGATQVSTSCGLALPLLSLAISQKSLLSAEFRQNSALFRPLGRIRSAEFTQFAFAKTSTPAYCK